MSELKCPFCNKPLQPTHRSVDEYWCENDDCPGASWKFGSISLWQELIRTRKALDVAVDALETFARIPQPIAEVAKVKLYAIKEITALEQKEHFADTSKKIEQKD